MAAFFIRNNPIVPDEAASDQKRGRKHAKNQPFLLTNPPFNDLIDYVNVYAID
jgi:hypothetical protein